jgi:hypothetical protein
MIEEEADDMLDTYSLSPKGKRLLKKFDKAYLAAWKAGHNEKESEIIALKKINADWLGLAIMRFIKEEEESFCELDE